MRYVYMALLAILVAIVSLFKFQNLETVTITLFSASVTMPASVLVLLVYVLGMISGGFVLALVQTWIRGARQRP
jgi:uncharacterized integral membrane protein